MSESDLQVLRLLGFGAALVLALAWQRLAPLRAQRSSAAVNVEFWLCGVLLTGLVCGACACAVARWCEARGLGLFGVVEAAPWLRVVVAVAVLDLVSWAWHRANHRVPFLWRWHQVHHSDPDFRVSTALRFHPGELLLSLPVRLLAVAALGVPPEAVVLFEVAFTLANLVEHGDIRIPAHVERGVQRVLVTPALHRLHHHADRPFRDRNFGTIFSLWDRLFGTFAACDATTEVPTGLRELPSPTFGRLLALPFRAAPR